MTSVFGKCWSLMRTLLFNALGFFKPFRCKTAPIADPPSSWTVGLGIGLLAFGIGCRLFLSWLNLPVFADEACLAINCFDRDYLGLSHELSYMQVAPVLFLWIEKAVLTLTGPSAWCLRLVPLMAGIGGLLLFWPVLRRCVSPMATCIAIGIMAVSEMAIVQSNTLKPYSLDLFFSVLFIWLALRIREPARRPLNVALLALLTPIAVFASYPSVFVAGSVSLALAPPIYRERSRRVWLGYLAFNLLLGVSFFVNLRYVGRPADPGDSGLQAHMHSYWSNGFPHGNVLEWAWWLISIHFGSLFSYPVSCKAGGIIGLVLAAIGIRRLWQEGRPFLLALCLLPYGLHLAAALMQRYPYGIYQRLEQDLLPCFCILAGSGTIDLIERYCSASRARMRVLAAIAAGFLLIGLGESIADLLQPYRDEEALCTRQVVEHLQRDMREGDIILVRGAVKELPYCMHWELISHLAGTVRESDRQGTASLNHVEGRIWLLDARVEYVSTDASEPDQHFPNRLDAELLVKENWGAKAAWRYCGYVGRTRKSVFRVLCDLYLCER